MDYRLIQVIEVTLELLKYFVFALVIALIVTLAVSTIQINLTTLVISILLLTNVYVGLLYMIDIDGHQQTIGLLSNYAFGEVITEDNVDDILDKLMKSSEETGCNITIIDDRKDKRDKT